MDDLRRQPPDPEAGTGAGADPNALSHGARTAPSPGFEVGDIYASGGEHEQALRVYLDAWPHVQSDPDDLQTTFGLARRIAFCLDRLGRHQEAIRLLEPVLERELAEPEALTGTLRLEIGRCRLVLGKSYYEAGRMAEAEAQGLLCARYLQQAQTAEPGFALNLLGTVAYRRGDIDLARTHWLAAQAHFRSRGDIGNLALSYINLGNVHKQRCECNRALEHYQAAFYLRAAEQDFRDQAGILQNIGLVQLRLGRFAEARARLEEGLRRAEQAHDRTRAVRARIALARLAREALDLESARLHLAACRPQDEPLPEREGCLLLLERARLAHLDGHEAEAEAALREVKHRVSRLAAQGDLMAECHLCEGIFQVDRGSPDEALECLERALSLAIDARDREQENRALLGLIEVGLRLGGRDEAVKRFATLEDRLRHSEETPHLACLYERRGLAELEGQSDPAAALHWLTKARDLWRHLTLPRVEARSELQISRALVRLGRMAEASANVLRVRERLGAPRSSVPSLEVLLARLDEDLSRHQPAPATLDGQAALIRLEEILGAGQSVGEKLRGMLSLVVEALGADGALLARVQEETAEVLSSVSMGRLLGKRTLSLPALGWSRDRASGVLLHAPGSGVQTSMLIPARFFGQEHLVLLERRDPARPAYVRSDVDYALVLLTEAGRRLRPEPASGRLDSTLEAANGNIYLADVVTQNPRMLSILELIRKVGDSDLSILLQGETGTGKKLLAQAIHRTSPRRDRPLVTVDCAALPDSLLESELFGHTKGAFTGATQDRVGLLEEANGGTIFLDEIDKAGQPVQRRFLHMLDSGEVRPVGSTGYRRLDVRVVCATSCPDLRQEVQEGRFLKDLYYRLNDIAIVVPALRERPEDVALLAEWYIELFAGRLGREIAGVAPAFHQALAAHSWPGNVRELEKAIRRAVTLAEPNALLQPDLLPATVLESWEHTGTAGGRSLREKMERFERNLLVEVLEQTKWNRTRAAAELGLSRKGLKNKICRYGLDRRRSRQS